MRIVSPGKALYVFVNVIQECTECGCEFQLAEADLVFAWSDQWNSSGGPSGFRFSPGSYMNKDWAQSTTWYYDCPICKRVVTLRKGAALTDENTY